MIEPGGVKSSPTTLAATFSTANKATKLSIDLGKGGSFSPLVLSNNPLQLKFRAKDFTGEYFHYSGDMFLIYKSGHLARLTCAPRERDLDGYGLLQRPPGALALSYRTSFLGVARPSALAGGFANV
jgi:hypothetical protein